MWKKYPLIRFLMPFTAGVLFVDRFPQLFNPLYLMATALLLSLILSLIWFRLDRRFRAIRGGFLIATVFIISVAYSAQVVKGSFELPETISNGPVTYIATITDPPTEKQRSIKLTCTIKQYKVKEAMELTFERCLIYLAKDSLSLNLKYGDEIVFRTRLKQVPPPLNPGEFNYQQTLYRKGIRFQSYIDRHSWMKTAEDQGGFFMSFAYNLRGKFLKILAQYGLERQEYGVIAAILLGYNDKLDPELSAHYAGAGVTHVLSVSGMHVGVIYMILNFFLQCMDRSRRTKMAKIFLLLFLIWLYAAITGLSPSVLRSATMFSFIAIGNAMKQKVDTYHSLLASLLFILLLDPFVLFNIGLQLSYLAVFGIVWLQRPIYLLWIPKTRLVKGAWELIAVSLAAQLVTTPVSIYYFHQFPNYFILSNLLVVLLSSFVIYAGVAVLFFSFWPWFADLLSMGMVWSIKLMNYITIYISDLPGSRTVNIDLDLISILLFYGIIFALLFALLERSKKMIWGVVACLSVFLVVLVVDNFQEYRSNKLIVYALHKQTMIDIKTSNQMISLCDSSLYFSEGDVPFQTKSTRIVEGVQPDSVLLLSSSAKWAKNRVLVESHFLKVGEKRIALVGDQPYECGAKALEVDYAIVFGNPRLKMGLASKAISAKTWAFDGSNSPYKVDKWVRECDSLHLKRYVLAKEGALVINF